ncbi:MAG: hypothetical protein SFU55_00830 [Methylophilus sp.]|nr:hypothetical protein [Methylophilus sp.]
MSTRKPYVKIFLFMLPALVTLIGYATFYEKLFQKPPCIFNCDHLTGDDNLANKLNLKNILDLMDELRGKQSNPSAAYPTRSDLDLAFLRNRIDAIESYFGELPNRGSEIWRKNQALSDQQHDFLDNTLALLDQKKHPSDHTAQRNSDGKDPEVEKIYDKFPESSPNTSNSPIYIVTLPETVSNTGGGGGGNTGGGGGGNTGGGGGGNTGGGDGGNTGGGDGGNTGGGGSNCPTYRMLNNECVIDIGHQEGEGSGSGSGGVNTVPLPPSSYLMFAGIVLFGLYKLKKSRFIRFYH